MMWIVGVYIVVVILVLAVGCVLMQVHGSNPAKRGRVMRWLVERKVELWSAFIALMVLLWLTFFHMLKLWLHL